MTSADTEDRSLICILIRAASFVPWLVAAGFIMTLCFALPDARAASVQPWTQGAAPVLSFETLDGQRYDAASLAGKTVVLNFWAAWCEPCRRELPAFERLAAALKGKPVIVLLVNIGDPRTVIDKVIAKTGLSMPTLRLTQGDMAANPWQISALPATVIIDADAQPRWLIKGAIDAQGEPLRSVLGKH
jgi:thiol-disulfide isomerase/thioredoxin